MSSFDHPPARIPAHTLPSNSWLPSRRALLATGAVAVLAASLPTSLPAQDTPKRGGVLKVAAPFNPSSLDPLTGGAGSDHMLLYPLFDTLVDFEPATLAPKPGLATSWEFTDPKTNGENGFNNAGKVPPPPEMQAAQVESQTATTEEGRRKAFAKLEKAALDHALSAEIAFVPGIEVYAPAVKGYVPNLLGKPKLNGIFLAD